MQSVKTYWLAIANLVQILEPNVFLNPCHFIIFLANNPRSYNNYTKINGHKNIHSSNCNILVKVVKLLRHALNITVYKQFFVILLLVKNVAVLIFFLLKYLKIYD